MPADAIVADGAKVPYPPATANPHLELELAVAIGGDGAGIARASAGPASPGQRLVGSIAGVGKLSVSVGDAA